MKRIVDILEEQWTDDVKTKWHPEEGLFTRRDPKYIANYLLRNSKDERQAMSRLVFYMNRAGDKLENRDTLERAKEIIKTHSIKEMRHIEDFIQKGRPVHEGWTGSDGDRAYDEILEVWENMSQEDILNMIWSYLDVDTLQNIYKWMKQDEYIV